MNRKSLLFVLAAALFVISGCGSPLTAGKIIDKRHEPAYYNDYTTLMCAGYNSKGVCIAWIPINHHDYVPDKWVLVLQDTVDGEIKQDDIEISQDRYEKCSVGYRYPECKPR